MEKKIIIILTGGLITSVGKNSNDRSIDLIESIKDTFSLDDIELIEFCLIDSSAVDLDFLTHLAKLVQRKINTDYVKGIIIIHGTDTIEISVRLI
jgi:L-asparaginase